METLPRPDLIVAIDFGMTCTGVAFVNLSAGSQRVRVIQKWPGRAQQNESKVPSSLVYPKVLESSLAVQPVAWGFHTDSYHDQHAQESEIREWFKILLDDGELREHQKRFPNEWPYSMGEVKKYYEDYLKLIYTRIEAELSPQLNAKTWEDAWIDFVFSLPTTWKDKTVVERFRSIVKRAGYGTNLKHSVEIGLTEAEAAAVFTSKEEIGIFKTGDVALVCDAGGGTTDLGVLRVDSTQDGVLVLRQLDVVQGKSIGSVQIDTEFARLVMHRLQTASQTQALALSDDEIAEAAYHAMKSSGFQTMKCEFGSDSTKGLRTFSIPVKTLPWNYVNRQWGISEQAIQISLSDFEILFNNQIQKLNDLIDGQIIRLQQGATLEQITHLILSGGLGNSEYVRSKLKERYEYGGTRQFINTARMQVRVAPEPQLAVCKGILEDRLQKLTIGKSVMGWRCCRESYGVGCKEIYDEKNPNHFHRQREIDPADGREYVSDGVAWFVKVGQPVSSDVPISYNFFRTLPYGDTNRSFKTNIYVCHTADSAFLPHYITKEVKQACTVESNFQHFTVDNFEEKKKRCWSKGKRHFIVRYVIKSIIGPADLRFELWFKEQKVNVDNAIQVEWFSTASPQPETQQTDSGHGVLIPDRYI